METMRYAPVLVALFTPELIAYTYHGYSMLGCNFSPKDKAQHLLSTNIIYWN